MDIERKLHLFCPEVKTTRFDDEHFQAEIVCESNGNEASLHLMENMLVVTGPRGPGRLPAVTCSLEDFSSVVAEVRKRLFLVDLKANK
jgi:hypothetical protein